jgi:NADH:ubiquinone oxidoreductase subunit 5 (subunit L)/multisubunit Na+/H+ antiporter MnhA subunit
MDLLPPWRYINVTAFVLLIASGVAGVAIGVAMPLSQAWARSTQKPLRILQDLLAYDFYTPKSSIASPLWGWWSGCRLASNWFDRYIVDGVVNSIGLASLMGGRKLEIQHIGAISGLHSDHYVWGGPVGAIDNLDNVVGPERDAECINFDSPRGNGNCQSVAATATR